MSTAPVAGIDDAFVYGLRFRALGGIASLPTATADDPSAAAVRVRQAHQQQPPPSVAAGPAPTRSVRVLADGRTLEIDPVVTARGTVGGTATLYGPPLEPDDLAHPYLTPIAVPFSRWNGREAFHSGVFARQGRAWVVRGARTAGKSSLMAALAGRGVDVLADDMAITDGDRVYTGPRSIDLREPVPGVDLPHRLARGGSRRRLLLPNAPGSVPLGGWLFLHWSPDPSADLQVHPVPPATLLARLARGRAHSHWDTDPSVLLGLASRPAYDLIRPRRWDAVPDVLDAILQLPGGAGRIPRQAVRDPLVARSTPASAGERR